MRISHFLLSVFIYLAAAFSFFSCQNSGIIFEETASAVKQYKPLFIPFKLNHTFENPFDPAEIKVDAIIKAPDGQTITLPCFYKGGESANSSWEARFTPTQSGIYTYHIKVKTAKDSHISQTQSMAAAASGLNGFLRMHNESDYALRFDSGKLFRGVGLNICWENQSEWPHPYETYFDSARANDINFIRIWMCPWNLPLEWSTIRNYENTTDSFANWDNTYAHSEGLKLEQGLTRYTEDDSNRVRLSGNSKESITWSFDNIRRFRMKIFYNGELSTGKIKAWGSADNETFTPLEAEFSSSWDTRENWKRIFFALIKDLPDGINYLKIEFDEGIKGDPHLADIRFEHGDATEVVDAPGLGRYYSKTAERMDELLELAAERDIYIMLAHDYHGQFKDYIDHWASNAEWRTHPYAVENGGPCEKPADFFTHPQARQYYKNRLRYMVARWGYSTNLAVWEFWNEIDNAMEWQKIPAKDIAAWHKEMAVFLKKTDPYQHIISTSVAHRPVPGLWEVNEIEFTQHHPYGPTDNIYNQIKEYVSKFNKPHVLGEFALSWKPPGQDAPAELYEDELHNGLWRGMFSPTPILPMTWWWEWHLHRNEYFHFKWANAFAQKMMTAENGHIKEVTITGSFKSLEAMALQSATGIFIRMLNKGKNPLTLKSLNIKINNGAYTAQWFNPWTGDFSEELKIIGKNGVLIFDKITISPARDMALWLKTKE